MEYNNIELFLYVDGSWKVVEVSDNIPFPIVFNIADVRDITKRNASYSKTLEIEGTKSNNDLFSYLFDISNVSTYNLNRKVKCTLVVDTVPVITDAFFQLMDIKTDDNLHFTYECVIFGDIDSISRDIGSKMMDDMNVEPLSHTYSEVNIVASWDNEWYDGYYYGLVDYGYNWDITKIGPAPANPLGARITEMRPCMSVKYLWNKMFSEAGWSYESNFISSTSSIWNDMYMLSGVDLKQSPTFSYYNSFRAAATGSITYVLGHTWSSVGSAANQWQGGVLQMGYTGSVVGYDGYMNVQSTLTSPVTVLSDYFKDMSNHTGFTSSRFKFQDETTSPNGDPASTWDPVNSQYIHPSSGSITSIGFQIKLSTPATASLIATNSFSPSTDKSMGIYFDLNVYRSSVYVMYGSTKYYLGISSVGSMESMFKMGAVANPYPIGDPAQYVRPGYQLMYGGSTYTKMFNTPLFDQAGTASLSNPWAKLQAGEKVWCKLTALPIGSVYGSWEIGPSFSYTVEQDSFIYSFVDTKLSENQPIDTKSMLPKNFKQIDFFNSMVKMFNLYVEPDKNISKRLRIEPRNDYYDSGTERNWTSKVDISKEIKQQLIAETQAKELFLTYKQDKDAYNENYYAQTKEIYGRYKYSVDNDFIKGESKVEVPYASTPNTYLLGYNNMSNDVIVLPVIAKNTNGVLNKTDFIPRILFKKKVSIVDPGNYWTFNGTKYNYYPYLGHFNLPRNGTMDLNFGQTKFLYYNMNSITTNNLFTSFYEKQLDELTDKDSRIVTLDMRLTPQDISDFSFRDRIILDGICSGTVNYFRVNKINYDPTSKCTFKVELLKAKDIPRRTFTPSFTVAAQSDPGSSEVSRILVGNMTRNTSYSSDVIINGEDNYIGSGARVINVSGDGNVVGDGVSEVSIFGDNNRALVDGVFIIGDGISATEPGIYMSSNPIVAVNYIDGGVDTILYPYGEANTINYIDGGVDSIRPLGSYTTVNYIDGGSDKVI